MGAGIGQHHLDPSASPSHMAFQGGGFEPGGLDSRIEKAIGIMTAASHRPLKVSDFARHTGLSLSRFCHLFSREAGLGPKQMLARIRLERAKALLSTTDMPLKQVAAAVGIPRADTFTRFFRTSCGMTPGQFRQYSRNSMNCK